MTNKKSLRTWINTAFESAENYSWVFYLIILVILLPIQLGIFQTQQNVIGIIIGISFIAITSQAVGKIRTRTPSSKPYIMCLKCNTMIESIGVWECKKCGWSSNFPDN